MKILYDSPGQTCNRLWSYITALSECIENNKRMAILFFDYTLLEFPSLAKNKYIYYPLKNDFIIKSIGYDKYMKIMYLIFGNRLLRYFYSSNIGGKLGFIEGWSFRLNNKVIQEDRKSVV